MKYTPKQKMDMIKEMTGEDPVDMFGPDAENIVEEINDCEKCGEEMSSRMAGDESYLYCRGCGFTDMH